MLQWRFLTAQSCCQDKLILIRQALYSRVEVLLFGLLSCAFRKSLTCIHLSSPCSKIWFSTAPHPVVSLVELRCEILKNLRKLQQKLPKNILPDVGRSQPTGGRIGGESSTLPTTGNLNQLVLGRKDNPVKSRFSSTRVSLMVAKKTSLYFCQQRRLHGSYCPVSSPFDLKIVHALLLDLVISDHHPWLSNIGELQLHKRQESW